MQTQRLLEILIHADYLQSQTAKAQSNVASLQLEPLRHWTMQHRTEEMSTTVLWPSPVVFWALASSFSLIKLAHQIKSYSASWQYKSATLADKLKKLHQHDISKVQAKI